MHLLGFHAFPQEARSAGDFNYVASVDVASALDAAPHASLIKTFEQAGTDTYTCRHLHQWLGRRSFRLRLPSPNGRYN